MLRVAVALIAAGALSACASGQGQTAVWKDVTGARRDAAVHEQDRRVCDHEAYRAEVNTHRYAPRPGYTDPTAARIASNLTAIAQAQSGDTAWMNCMRGRGWDIVAWE